MIVMQEQWKKVKKNKKYKTYWGSKKDKNDTLQVLVRLPFVSLSLCFSVYQYVTCSAHAIDVLFTLSWGSNARIIKSSSTKPETLEVL